MSITRYRKNGGPTGVACRSPSHTNTSRINGGSTVAISSIVTLGRIPTYSCSGLCPNFGSVSIWAFSPIFLQSLLSERRAADKHCCKHTIVARCRRTYCSMSASSAACLIRIDHFMPAPTWNAGRHNLNVHAQRSAWGQTRHFGALPSTSGPPPGTDMAPIPGIVRRPVHGGSRDIGNCPLWAQRRIVGSRIFFGSGLLWAAVS